MALANFFFSFRAGHLLVIEFVVLRSNLTWCTLSFLDFIATVFFMVLGVLDPNMYLFLSSQLFSMSWGLLLLEIGSIPWLFLDCTVFPLPTKP